MVTGRYIYKPEHIEDLADATYIAPDTHRMTWLASNMHCNPQMWCVGGIFFSNHSGHLRCPEWWKSGVRWVSGPIWGGLEGLRGLWGLCAGFLKNRVCHPHLTPPRGGGLIVESERK